MLYQKFKNILRQILIFQKYQEQNIKFLDMNKNLWKQFFNKVNKIKNNFKVLKYKCKRIRPK